MFKVQIDTGNAAFDEDNGGAAAETARILREIANKLESGRTEGVAVDGYGNSVGRFTLDA